MEDGDVQDGTVGQRQTRGDAQFGQPQRLFIIVHRARALAASPLATRPNSRTILGNNQTYTLSGVSLGQLQMGNIAALDPGTLAQWQTLIAAAKSV